MKRLYVLFDAECGLCRMCRNWLKAQPAFIELSFIALQSSEIDNLFPGLRDWNQLDLSEKLVAISDEGAVYQGQHAWIMCLYALREHRALSLRLANPLLLPFARRVCELVSSNRLWISRLMQEPLETLSQRLGSIPRPDICHEGRSSA